MVSTRGLAVLSAAKGWAAIFFWMFSQANSLFGIGPMMPKLLRVGIRKTGIAPVMMMECRIDLWQLRSTTTMSPGATVECQTILFEVEVPLVTKIQVVGVEDARRVALGGGDRAGVVEQLAEFLDGVADVGAQHVLAEELVEHLADRRLQEGDAARVAGAVPGIGTVGGVVGQRAEEGRRQRVEVGLGLAHDVAGDELRRVLEHVDEAVQLAQDVVRDVARGARLAVQEDRDLGVAAADFLDEGAQLGDAFPLARCASSSSSIDRMKAEARLCCWAKEVRSP